MAREYLGVGLGFPVFPDKPEGISQEIPDQQLTALPEPDEGLKQGFLKIKSARYEESVRQSIWIVLGTAKGERVMRPEFGCGIYDLVFEVNNASTAGRVTEAVREALLAFEPRIDVRDVQIRSEQQGEVMLISIDYEVRATNNAFNLVYPFYLERGVL